MSITYTGSLGSAYIRMKKALFGPFSLQKWLVVGFAAFLARLFDGLFGAGNTGTPDIKISADSAGEALQSLAELPVTAWTWLTDNPGWFALGIAGTLAIAALSLLLLWLSSRGKFVFLHNVMYDQAEIRMPWRHYARLGNSLFLWRLAFSAISLAAFMAVGGLGGTAIYVLADRAPQFMVIATAVGMALSVMAMTIMVMYISLFLESFVVPIMAKFNLKANLAWREFLPLLRANLESFILYGFFVFILFIAAGLAVFTAGCLTCCLGLALLAIPYVGSVILLPLSYTYRAFSLEFMESVDTRFAIFPRPSQPEVLKEQTDPGASEDPAPPTGE